MKSKSILIRCAKVFLVLQLILMGFALLSIVLPNKLIKKHIEQSAFKYRDEILYPEYFIHGAQHRLDNYTDYLIMNVMYNVNPHKPFKSLLFPSGHYIEITNQAPIHLQFSIENQSVDRNFIYGRYWMGSSFAYRWLFFMGDLTLVRWLLFAIGSLVLFSFAAKLKETIGFMPMLMIAVGLVFVNYYLFFTSLQFFPVYMIVFLGTLALIRQEKKHKDLYVLFLVLGSVTTYFDLLTTPILTLGVPLLVWISMQNSIKDLFQKVKSIFAFSTVWVFGFFATWAFKWGLIYAFTDYSILEEIRMKVMERAGIEQEFKVSAFTAIQNNLDMLIYAPFLVTALLLILFAGLFFKKTGWKKAVLFLIPALLPFVWSFLTKGHIEGHFWFTYRNFWLSVSGILLALTSLIRWEDIRTLQFKKQKS